MCSFKLKRLLVCSVGKNGTDLQSPNQRGKKRKKIAYSGNGRIRNLYIKNEKECLS